MFRILIVSCALAMIAGCNDDVLTSVAKKANEPLPQSIVATMHEKDMSKTSPIMMRIFKEEGVLEVWKQKGDGTYGKVADYEICAWSGKLGPKLKEGDRQAPEGFYLIKPAQMNPNSSYYLSFNIGFPNNYDESQGRTGSNIMIHGACSSAGCYSMTDENVAQIYAFARDAFRGGQRSFQVEAFPFRMTPANMAKHRTNPNFEFWKMLKVGYDYFEITKRPPDVEVCDRKYVFNQQVMDDSPFVATAACPSMKTPDTLRTAYSSYEQQYDTAYEQAVAEQKADATQKQMIAERKQAVEDARAQREVAAAERKAQSRQAANSFISSLMPGSNGSDAGRAMAEAGMTTGSIGAPQTRQAAPTTSPVQAKPADDKKPFWKLW
nr:L,D-transpeptidase family protein [Pararhizobium mangrovi]